MNENLYKCLDCGKEFLWKEIENVDFCPNCEDIWLRGESKRYGEFVGEYKKCKTCKMEKDLINFASIENKKKIYYNHECRQCQVLYKRQKYHYKRRFIPHFYLLDLKCDCVCLKLKNDIVLFDLSDFEKIKNYSWEIDWKNKNPLKSKYARGKIKGQHKIFAHRLILGDKIPDGKVIDHIDRNGLNNIKNNLRFATMSENVINTVGGHDNFSGYKGVTFSQGTCQRKKPWISKITKNGKIIYIGRYSTAEEAGYAYDNKALELFGEFAYLNFPSETK